jgi:hypothetical protein
MKNGNQPINARVAFDKNGLITSDFDEYNGLTKREYFAALAMQATDLELYAKSYGHKWAEEVAKDSVKMADALLKQLENQTP